MPENDYINGIPHSSSAKSGKDDRELLVMITATIVDAAGNRIHTDNELPRYQAGIPPQPNIQIITIPTQSP